MHTGGQSTLRKHVLCTWICSFSIGVEHCMIGFR
ncbi:hypothetical protein GLP30_00005 [Photobacterium phosphoreum]|uniref:DUF3265 domain-containing protein n=1 Tax=Photobacterium phosphoreum TaxID=659 RepID=A0AAW4ZJJ6_PHOPO|nr:hypothetical protein [Photobacterium phosphoreum]MCF2188478.1 hypothetical protein [Photobacterium phosphoreum]MCF2300121.1 hypothetical protein [Photobacterium phosphoreum]